MSEAFFTGSAILFELNGVFADSINVMYDTYIEFIGQFNIEGNSDEFEQRLKGPSDKEIVNYLKATYNLEQELTDLDEFFFLLTKKNYDEKVKLVDGAVDCLQFFKSQNFLMGLITSSTKEVIWDFLEKNGLNKYFEFVLTGDKVSASKPSPEMIINALNRLNCSETSVFVVENSKNGITAAYKAGVMKIIGIGPKSTHINLMKSGAMLAVENLKELQNLPWKLE
jgi:HAD superfamily hydrolase (TIGR01549 family)